MAAFGGLLLLVAFFQGQADAETSGAIEGHAKLVNPCGLLGLTLPLGGKRYGKRSGTERGLTLTQTNRVKKKRLQSEPQVRSPEYPRVSTDMARILKARHWPG